MSTSNKTLTAVVSNYLPNEKQLAKAVADKAKYVKDQTANLAKLEADLKKLQDADAKKVAIEKTEPQTFTAEIAVIEQLRKSIASAQAFTEAPEHEQLFDWFNENVEKIASEKPEVAALKTLGDPVFSSMMKAFVDGIRSQVYPVLKQMENDYKTTKLAEVTAQVVEATKAILPAGFEITVSLKGKSRTTPYASQTGEKKTEGTGNGKGRSCKMTYLKDGQKLTETFPSAHAAAVAFSEAYNYPLPESSTNYWVWMPRKAKQYAFTFEEVTA